MARSEVQKSADKKHREAHKGDRTTWTTKFKPTELAEIDAVIKSSGKSRAGFIRWAVENSKKKITSI